MQELLDPLNGFIAYPVWISIYCKFVFDNQKQIHYNEIILKRRYESWTFTYVTETISGEVAWLGVETMNIILYTIYFILVYARNYRAISKALL